MTQREDAGTRTLPKVKQCNIIGDQQFGATATAAGPNRWLVANPDNGGHWATDDDVNDWDAATSPAPKDPPAPAPEG
jgi:hypothetical protein